MPFEHPFAKGAALRSRDIRIEVSQDLSGGVRVSLVGASFVLSPQDAVNFATILLKAAGVEVAMETAFGPIRTDLVKGH